MSTFLDIIDRTSWPALGSAIDAATPADVERALAAERPSDDDLIALFSPAAARYLEPLAQRAAALTERRFGKVIQLYAPVYLTNECVNKCAYCGFSHELEIPRVTLTPARVLAEAEILHAQGFRHILLVAGEDRRAVNLPYLKEVVAALNDRFEAISIEIQPLEREEYRELVDAGVDGLVIYQEVYDPRLYVKYHLAGPKRNYRKRLRAIEAGGEAGMRTLGVGALLGLAPWRPEAVMVARHARWLMRRFWRARIAVSFPRIRAQAHEYQPDYPVSDADLVQMICAMRIALPDAELVLSTREPARLRDRLLGLGITRTSAGSSTVPGGYTSHDHAGEQFEIEDSRSPAEVASVIADLGFEPVWKDFDRMFVLAR